MVGDERKLLLQSELGYGDIFTDTWKAFTDHHVIPLKDYADRKVSILLLSLSETCSML